MTCRTCRYFLLWRVQSRAPGVFGECRRHAPGIIFKSPTHQPMTKWPSVNQEDWCGSYKEKEKETCEQRS